MALARPPPHTALKYVCTPGAALPSRTHPQKQESGHLHRRIDTHGRLVRADLSLIADRRRVLVTMHGIQCEISASAPLGAIGMLLFLCECFSAHAFAFCRSFEQTLGPFAFIFSLAACIHFTHCFMTDEQMADYENEHHVELLIAHCCLSFAHCDIRTDLWEAMATGL